jgi:hypothetical protein
MADNLPTTLPPSRNDPSVATSDDEIIDLTPDGVRRGRRPKFTAAEDMIIAREVAAAKAHIASFGTKRERLAAAAERANANPTMKTAVTSKSIQDRYVKLQKIYDRGDAAQRKMSGVGGDVGELDELLAGMQQDRDDLETNRAAERSAATEREEVKERIGKELVVRALNSDCRNEGESVLAPALLKLVNRTG